MPSPAGGRHRTIETASRHPHTPGTLKRAAEARLPYWSRDMEFDIESWVPYKCDFKPITTNSLFSDALGKIAGMAMRMESEFLYMESGDSCPVGTLVPENLIHPSIHLEGSSRFAMVFSYSSAMEGVLFDIANGKDDFGGLGDFGPFGAGIAVCGIWKSGILMDECKVLLVASSSPFFDQDAFLDCLYSHLTDATNLSKAGNGDNIPYFAEKFGYRRFQIPYETDDVTDLRISSILLSFEFDETRAYVGPNPELYLDIL